MKGDFVLDASAIIDVLKRIPGAQLTEEILSSRDARVHVPHFCDLEIANWTRKRIQQRSITERQALDRLSQYASLPIQRHDHLSLLPSILRLVKNFTAYDASYVALAQALRAPLVTSDLKMARALRQHTDISVVAGRG